MLLVLAVSIDLINYFLISSVSMSFLSHVFSLFFVTLSDLRRDLGCDFENDLVWKHSHFGPFGYQTIWDWVTLMVEVDTASS